MGNMYTVHIVRNGRPMDVLGALHGRDAALFFVRPGWSIVSDRLSGLQHPQSVEAVARLLSRSGGPCMSVLNHDDDALQVQVAIDGRVVDIYESSPGWGDGRVLRPTGGRARGWCHSFAEDDPGLSAELERVLRYWRGASPADAPWKLSEDGRLDEVDRHAAIARLLGMPPQSVGVGYASLALGELPAGLDAGDITWLKDPTGGPPGVLGFPGLTILGGLGDA